MDLCKYTERLWRLYSLGEMPDINENLFERMAEDIIVIGTGKHEYYEGLDCFMESVRGEEKERSQISFVIDSFGCKEQKLNELTSLVHGHIHLKGTGVDQNVLVDMDTRFSMVFSKNDGDWKLVHIHQSLPYVEQMEGEYYPKTLMDQVSELETLAKTDLLTGLLNHQAFYNCANALPVESACGYFMLIDLDDFKQINDTYGHMYGDNVLKKVGRVLSAMLKDGDYAGRIGGDEFALYFSKVSSDKEAALLAEKILEDLHQTAQESGLKLPGLSIGIASKNSGEKSKKALIKADEKMYEAKQSGKNRYQL